MMVSVKVGFLTHLAAEGGLSGRAQCFSGLARFVF